MYEMVQQILLSTRGYVNFVNEVFRQVSVCVCVCVCVCDKFMKLKRLVLALLLIVLQEILKMPLASWLFCGYVHVMGTSC